MSLQINREPILHPEKPRISNSCSFLYALLDFDTPFRFCVSIVATDLSSQAAKYGNFFKMINLPFKCRTTGNVLSHDFRRLAQFNSAITQTVRSVLCNNWR